MAIDVKNEHLLSVAQLAREVPPTGVDPCTVWRWVHKGLKGVKLEITRIGGRVFTSRESFQRLNDQLTENADGPKRITSTERKRAIRSAERRLESLGI